MPELPVNPPTEKMIRQLPAPDHTLVLYTELISRESPRYQALSPIKRGSIYFDGKGTDQAVIDAYPALYFCKEIVPLGSTNVNTMQQDKYCIWIWSTSSDTDSSYNAAVDYLGDAVANPAFTRIYTVRRDVYEGSPTIALGSTLTALTGVAITAAGSGYTYAVGTVGTGATIEFVISGGTIVAGIVTSEGSGVTTGASITITGDGTGATATARVQPVGAILTSQKKVELPDNDPLSHEFISVVRTYELLPGPLLAMTRYDELLGPIQGTRQAAVWASAAPSLTATAKITYEARQDSSYVAWKLTEDWSANGGYPIVTSKYHDDARGEVSRTTQLEIKAAQVSSSVVATGTVTQINYQEYNPFLYKKIVETWTVPKTFNDQEYDKTLDVVFPIQRKREASGTSIGVAHAKVTAQGDGTDITEIPDLTTLAAALNAYVATFPTTVDCTFPPELTNIAIYWEISNADGDSSDTSSGTATGNPFSIALSSSVEAQGSATVMPEISPKYKIVDGNDVPAIDYYFFLANPVTRAAVLSKVTTLAGAVVVDWPRFHPDIPVFVLQGQKASASAHANAKATVDDTATSFATGTVHGDGLSQDFGSSIGSRQLERCIHGNVGVAGSANVFQDFTVTAEANANVGAISAIGGPRSETITVEGQINPTATGATSGATSVPTSGLRLKNCDVNIYGYGYSVVRARVIDFSVFT